jgi:hypothetical protein
MRVRELVILVVLAGCGGGDDDGGGGSDADAAPDEPDACPGPAGDPAIVYLNRGGATVTPGPEDAVANTTGLTEAERVLPPAPFDEPHWAAVRACIDAALVPFHIDLVEEDPGDVDHTEVLFTERGDWFEQGVGSVSNFSCAGFPRAMAFVFEADDTELHCHIAVNQLAGLATGLEHTVVCEDYMSSCFGDGSEKSWVDEDLACGDLDDEVACQCGGDTQNSYQAMVERFGSRCL